MAAPPCVESSCDGARSVPGGRSVPRIRPRADGGGPARDARQTRSRSRHRRRVATWQEDCRQYAHTNMAGAGRPHGGVRAGVVRRFPMITRMLMTLLAIIALASAAGAAEEARHSGTIVGLRQDPAQLVMEEIVTWIGPNSGRVRRTIDMTANTSIQVVRRTDTWTVSRTSKPGFEERAIEPSALRVGDFVTV